MKLRHPLTLCPLVRLESLWLWRVSLSCAFLLNPIL